MSDDKASEVITEERFEHILSELMPDNQDRIRLYLSQQIAAAEIRGIESVLRIRCTDHVRVAQLNTCEHGGGECGACAEIRGIREGWCGKAGVCGDWKHIDDYLAKRKG